MGHKSGAVMAKKMSEWLNPYNEQHLQAFLLWKRGCQFPSGFEPSDVWRDPNWPDKVSDRIESEGITIPPKVQSLVDNYDRLSEIIDDCTFPGYEFMLSTIGDQFVLRLMYYEPDVYSGEDEPQFTRPWLVSPYATTSEAVQTVFKAILTSMEHRARENFHWRGKPVLMPHLDIEKLWQMLPDGMHQTECINEGNRAMAASPANGPS
jgi:hypothetical protein